MTFLDYGIFPLIVTLARRCRGRRQRKLTAAHRKYVSQKWNEAEAARHVEPLIAFMRHGCYEGMKKYNSCKALGRHPRASNRMNRGGNWNYNARNCRSAYRNNNTSGYRNNNIGFRLAAVREEARECT